MGTNAKIASAMVSVLMPAMVYNAHAQDAGKSEVVPFKRILTIEPGRTTQEDVLKLLGKPEETEITNERQSGNIKLGGVKLLKYPSRGIMLIIARENVKDANPVIDRMVVNAPFKGKADNGLAIGLPEEDARRICARDYHVNVDLTTSLLVAPAKGRPTGMQLWFKDGKLSGLSVP